MNLKTLHMAYKTAKESLATYLCKGLDAPTLVHPHLPVGIPVVIREAIMENGRAVRLEEVIEIKMCNLIEIQVQLRFFYICCFFVCDKPFSLYLIASELQL